jgi:hypothetical protein
LHHEIMRTKNIFVYDGIVVIHSTHVLRRTGSTFMEREMSRRSTQ